MKSFLAAVATLLLTTPSLAWDNAAMNAQVDQTNFLMNDNCSATLINKAGGYLLTANHCVRDQFKVIEREKIDDNGVVTTEKIRVSVPGTVSQLFFSGPNEVSRTSYTFKIVKNSADTDLAIVQVLTKLPNTLESKISCTEPQRLDEVAAVGNTRGVLYSSITKGTVASVNRNYRMLGGDKDQGLTHSTAAIGGGNSGGALYNTKGEIIGVVVMGYQNVSPLGFAVALSDIKLMVNSIDALKVECK